MNEQPNPYAPPSVPGGYPSAPAGVPQPQYPQPPQTPAPVSMPTMPPQTPAPAPMPTPMPQYRPPTVDSAPPSVPYAPAQHAGHNQPSAPPPPGYAEAETGVLSTTANDIPGYEITHVIGLCWGIIARSLGFSRGMTMGVRSLVRTELVEMTRTLDEARHEAERRLLANARARGGNAVVAVRFDSSSAQGMAEITAYGTAVVVQPVTTTD